MTPTRVTGGVRAGRAVATGRALVVLLAVLPAAAACGSSPAPVGDTVVRSSTAAPGPAAGSTAAVDPATDPYCATVRRVQAEQTAQSRGTPGGTTVAAASEAARRQVGDLAATAPPEIAADWRVLVTLTDRALAVIASTGADPARVDRSALTAISAEGRPAVTRIEAATSRRCGVAFRPPA